MVEDLRDRAAVYEWREEEAAARAENRRRAAHHAKLTRSRKMKNAQRTKANIDKAATELSGWEDFDSDGLLR